MANNDRVSGFIVSTLILDAPSCPIYLSMLKGAMLGNGYPAQSMVRFQAHRCAEVSKVLRMLGWACKRDLVVSEHVFETSGLVCSLPAKQPRSHDRTPITSGPGAPSQVQEQHHSGGAPEGTPGIGN